jgi:hypothetical protein
MIARVFHLNRQKPTFHFLNGLMSSGIARLFDAQGEYSQSPLNRKYELQQDFNHFTEFLSIIYGISFYLAE